MRALIVLWAAVALGGCYLGGSGGDDGKGRRDSGGDRIDIGYTDYTDYTRHTGLDTTTSQLVVVADWTDDGLLPDEGCGDSVFIGIDDPLGESNWAFGMSETGSPSGWLGEDCYQGYAAYNLCHAIGPNTVLDQVASCAAADVVAGSTTLLSADKDPYLTYYLEDSAGSCFVWGHDVSYYGPLACVQMM